MIGYWMVYDWIYLMNWLKFLFFFCQFIGIPYLRTSTMGWDSDVSLKAIVEHHCCH